MEFVVGKTAVVAEAPEAKEEKPVAKPAKAVKTAKPVAAKRVTKKKA
jgi:hypothetical protein